MYAYKPKTRVAVLIPTLPAQSNPMYALGTITQRRNGLYFVQTDAGPVFKVPESAVTPVDTNRQIKRNLTQVELQSLLVKHGVERYFSRAYFNAAEYVHAEVNEKFPEGKKFAPIDMNEFCRFDSIGDNVFEFVRIKRGPKEKDNDYFDTLSEVTPVDFEITIKERATAA